MVWMDSKTLIESLSLLVLLVILDCRYRLGCSLIKEEPRQLVTVFLTTGQKYFSVT